MEKWNTVGLDAVCFYGPNGKLLSVLTVNINASAPLLTLTTVRNRIYFGGMLLGTSTGTAIGDGDVIKDRLGTKNPGYPYGTDIAPPPGDGDDFATYWKDGTTGFQYAMNRYYSASYGRFLTVDAFGGSGRLGSPGTLNRYSYASNDPVNRLDPSGLDDGDPVAVDNGVPLYLSNSTEMDVTDLPDDGDQGMYSPCSDYGNPFLVSICEGFNPFYNFHPTYSVGFGPKMAYNLAQGYRAAVKQGIVTDCQALADFADDVAGQALSINQFVSDFGVLTPGPGSNVPGTGISWNSAPVLLNSGQSSGYTTPYQNTVPDGSSTNPNWNGDQGHHFAAFFQFGYINGAAAGSVLAFGMEYFQGLPSGILNAGDVALGQFAAQLGAQVKAGTLASTAVGGQISKVLCDQ